MGTSASSTPPDPGGGVSSETSPREAPDRDSGAGPRPAAAAPTERERAFHGMVTRSPAMEATFRYAEAVAGSRQPLLIVGETGVGKELFARAVHEAAGLGGEFLAVNVAGLDDAMFSDTLFGHVKGAYTGAVEEREGLLTRAAGGTLLLDEIGELGTRAQIRLLRLLEEREYYPLGSDRVRSTDARIVCATCHDLEKAVSRGTFRRDLYYRLRAHHVYLPPLRERVEDLPLLADHYLREAAAALGKKKPTPPPELFHLLATYAFPGNVRELRAMVYDAVAQHRSGILSVESFREVIEGRRAARGPAGTEGPNGALPAAGLAISGPFPTLKDAEEFLVDEALRRAGNNQRVAARLLGVSREGLNKRLARRKRLREREEPRRRSA